MAYQGGIARNSHLFRTQMISKMTNDIEEEREVLRRELEVD